MAIGVVVAVCILASAVPLSVLKNMVTPLAGKTTKIQVNIALALTVGISVVLNGFQWLKGTFRKREIKRLRSRADALEHGLPVPLRSHD